MILKVIIKRVLYYCVTAILLFICTENLQAQLTADFKTNTPGGCSPVVINFTNNTLKASPAAAYLWNFGNGNTSTLTSPGAVYSAAGKYTVTLTVKDGGSSSSKSKEVTVYANPEVGFSTSPLKGCAPLAVDFTANATAGSGTISYYYWDFGDGNTQKVFDTGTSHTYIVSQDASISLTVANSYGCTKTISKEKVVKVFSPIAADFGANKTVLCSAAETVQFINASTGSGSLSYVWDFGDGSISATKEPTHKFSGPGIFTVSIKVVSSDGCSAADTKNDFINIASFKSDFTVPARLCSGNTISFISSSVPLSQSSIWNVDGTAINTDSLDYTFNDTGSHTIKLINNFGNCNDSVTKIISVKQTPAINDFIAAITGNCGSPVAVNFKDISADAVKWEWNFNSIFSPGIINSTVKEPAYTYTSDGEYMISLKIENAAGCPDSIRKPVKIFSPYIYITATKMPADCGPYSIIFSAAGTIETIADYKWDFGDGTTSTAANPTHFFNNPGSYPVTLSYTTGSGCKGTVSNGVYVVYKKPIAGFSTTTTNVCGNTAVIFNALPQDGAMYSWDFGDGTSSNTGPTVAHQYNYDSTFTVTLVVSNPGGCRDTLTKINYVKVSPPFPKISGAANTCSQTRGEVTFTQESKKAITWTWDWGDGSNVALNTDEPVYKHTYTKTGLYKAVLITTNGQCTVRDSLNINVLLKQKPLLIANKSTVCSQNDELPITIKNLDANPVASSMQNQYDFDKIAYTDLSGFTGNIKNNIPGFWSNVFNGSLSGFEKDKNGIRIILKSAGFGCADTTNIIPLNIKWSEAAYTFVSNNVCFQSPAVFNNTSKTNNTILSWQWDYGDGIIQTLNTGGSVSHKYTNPGSYIVSLAVTDSFGCSAVSNSVSYAEIKGPKASFTTPGASFITLPVSFINSTNTYNSSNTQYQWHFGDGSSSSIFEPVHTYNQPGEYTVTLTAIDPVSKCADSFSQKIYINNFLPAFSVTSSYLIDSCPPILVKFTNNSINYTSIKWDFGDGTPAENLNTPTHIYNRPGKFIITLHVFGPSGLTGIFIDSITIKMPDADISIDKHEGCIGHIASFKATVKNAVSFTWDFGDGTVLLNSASITSHQYTAPGTYNPLLVLTDSSGCKIPKIFDEKIIIRKDPAITFVPAAPVICRGSSVNITASGGNTYLWSPPEKLNNIKTASVTANPLITSTYTVKASDDLGCSSIANVTVTIIQPVKVSATAPPSACIGTGVQLEAKGASIYKWINNTGNLSNINIANPVARPAGITSYTVAGKDSYSCFADTASLTVNVLPLPYVKILAVDEQFVGNPVQLSVNTSADVINWKWSPSNGLSCIHCPAPTATPFTDVNYQLTVTNKDGCIATGNVLIKVKCGDSYVMIPSAFSPNGDGLNDVFVIRGISKVKHLVIYNRWGNVVFESKDTNTGDRANGWDGTYKGEPQPQGTYLYFAEMECAQGTPFVRKGTLVLVK